MTRDAYVVGAAMAPMGKYRTSSYAGIAAPVVRAAMLDAGVEPGDIDTVYCGHAYGGMMTGQRILKSAGINSVPVINVDNACSGGATALREAVRAVRDGHAEVALALGVEKLTQFSGGTLPLVEEDPEVQLGVTMPSVYAMRARRFLYERGASPSDLAAVAVKARKHGSLNPYAYFRTESSEEEVLASRMIADPLTLMQCCPSVDGAAAVIVVSEDYYRRIGAGPAMRVAASVLHSGRYEPGFRDMLHPDISYHSASEAYEEAGIGPSDLDMIELHDAFSIAELVYYEAFQLCEPGGSVDLLRSGATSLGGDVVVNPSGGLLAKGHPVGASGVAQVVEAFWQLTGRAGARQIDGARRALTHVTGGGVSGLDHGACTVHIFEGVV